ncbi:MAG TPA: hypothetical protein VFK41_02390 [Nocardioidaceae bacterium]|nr:hypothetical protein [Nocardioidaceae bacterium]
MGDAVGTLLPLFLFMLIPLWIPIFASLVGFVLDSLGRDRAAYSLPVKQRATVEPGSATA